MLSNTIQFLFENKIYKIKNPDPNKTILNYVRDDLKKTGTKEGIFSKKVKLGFPPIFCGQSSIIIKLIIKIAIDNPTHP